MKPDFPKDKLPSANMPRPTWQEYQAELKRRTLRKRHTRGFLRWTVPLLALAASLYGLAASIDGFSSTPADDPKPKPPIMHPDSEGPQETVTTDPGSPINPMAVLLKNPPFFKEIPEHWTADVNGNRYRVETTLNGSLQDYLNDKLDRKSSKQIAVVVVEPSTGRILSLAGHDRLDPSNNPCLDSDFPAASIFKIVTASAAIETHGFKPETAFLYNGRKHTLYKSQLKSQKNKYSHRITFRDSFAQSVNPVFGKLGIYHLGVDQIERYARAFGFGEEIASELGTYQNRLFISQEPYHLAEIASGFNRKTTLSPLHGALIAAAVLNGGRLMAPAFIDRITNGSGEMVYQGKPSQLRQVITPETASVLSNLMQATIRSGTSRKAFRGYRYDKVLSKLVIGGKTGSISNLAQTSKYDWFVGFAKEREGSKSIAVSVLVVHDKTLSRKAGSYARMAMKAYYGAHFNGKSITVIRNRQS